MAGRGPAPKPASTRARRNGGSVSDRVIMIKPAGQPDMPDVMPNGEPWPTETGRWWNMWAEHPLAAEFTASDWFFLKDTALLHGLYWSGDLTVAGELRLRVAKYGATPEDRARLRIQFAVADESEIKVATRRQPTAAAKKTAARKRAAAKKADPRQVLQSVS